MITKAELIKCMEEKIPVRLRNGMKAFETGSVYATEEDALANLSAYMKDIE